MMYSRRLTKISVILSTLLVVHGNSQLTNNCNYSQHPQILTCVDIDFNDSKLEHYITNNTHVLIIKECDNLEIPSNYHIGNNFLHITSYQLINNGIITIDSSAFRRLDNLRYLKIDNNQNWLLLKANTFAGLEKLETLSIANNSMKTLEKNAFQGLSDLDVLDLTHNKITVIPSSIFQPLKHLTSLFLSHNDIEILEDNCFDGLVEVQLLDMTYNNLKVFNSKDFNSLTKLSDLYLSFNQIDHIDGKLVLTNLRFLYLKHNKLTAITKEDFDSLENMKSIDLSENEISIIPDNTFLKLKHLDLINLRNNNRNGFDNLKLNELNKPHLVV